MVARRSARTASPATPAPPTVASPFNASDSDASEPDPGPSSLASYDGSDVGKVPARVDLRNVKIAPFDGSVPDGAFDAGARDWWEQFSQQLRHAQTLSHQQWSDEVKLAATALFLSGTASRWFRKFQADPPGASFVDAGAALIARFRPSLSHQEIANRIYREGKRPRETYQAYADRLSQMADTLDGGISVNTNAQCALSTFLRLAWPSKADIAMSRVDVRSPTALDDMDRAVAVLCGLSGHDGRLPDIKRRHSDADNKPAKRGKAQATVVERKRKVTFAKHPGSKIICYTCGQAGHTSKFHHKHFGAAKPGDKHDRKGAAHSVNANVDPDASSSDDA